MAANPRAGGIRRGGGALTGAARGHEIHFILWRRGNSNDQQHC
jgi:hypothetical protein